METILNTLVYDGKAERTILADGNHMYRAIEPLLPPPGIVQTPCGVCPVTISLLLFYELINSHGVSVMTCHFCYRF